ncbi:MAG: PAS domain S-box protein, partial [bacterium]|nr:PAS domain S-box protein [bacterium]
DGFPVLFTNIGKAYQQSGDKPKALEYYRQAVSAAKEIAIPLESVQPLLNIASLFHESRRFAEALQKVRSALGLAEKTGNKEIVRNCRKQLADIYYAMGRHKQAYQQLKEFKALDDELFKSTSSSKLTEIEAGYEIEKREKEIDLLKKKEKIQDLQISKHKTLLKFYVLVGVLILIIALFNFLLYRYRKRAGRKVAESEAKYRSVVERAHEGIVIIQECKVRYMNPSLAQMIGYSWEEVPEVSYDMLIPENLREKMKNNYESRLSGNAVPNVYETALLHKNGETLDVEVNAGLITYGKQPAVMAFLRPTYEKKQLEAERLRRMKLEAVGQLAAGIAHDFNNILAVILGNIAMARTCIQTGKQPLKMLTKIENSSLNARDLAQQFLTFSEGGIPFKRDESLERIINEAKKWAADSSEITLGEHNIKTDIPADLPAVVCEARQIGQVFQAVISNAVEAMGNKVGTIHIGARSFTLEAPKWEIAPGPYVRLTIGDEGEGIPKENLLKIFDPYFSTRNQVSRKGLGLGLAIVYSIVKQHGGHIEAESEVGTGTVITIYLPAAPVPPAGLPAGQRAAPLGTPMQ